MESVQIYKQKIIYFLTLRYVKPSSSQSKVYTEKTNNNNNNQVLGSQDLHDFFNYTKDKMIFF